VVARNDIRLQVFFRSLAFPSFLVSYHGAISISASEDYFTRALSFQQFIMPQSNNTNADKGKQGSQGGGGGGKPLTRAPTNKMEAPEKAPKAPETKSKSYAEKEPKKKPGATSTERPEKASTAPETKSKADAEKEPKKKPGAVGKESPENAPKAPETKANSEQELKKKPDSSSDASGTVMSLKPSEGLSLAIVATLKIELEQTRSDLLKINRKMQIQAFAQEFGRCSSEENCSTG
jgi:hypothetical protein